MILNYLGNILLTGLYIASSGIYLSLKWSNGSIFLDLLLLGMMIFCGISCSFADPGIVTIKSSVMPLDEEETFPKKEIVHGIDYYKQDK